MRHSPSPRSRCLASLAGLATLIVAAPCWAALVPCAATVVRPLPAPAEGAVEGYRKAPPVAGCLFGSRLDAGGGVSLWRCVVDTPDDAPEDAWSHALLVMRDGAPPQAFKDDIMAGAMGAFHLLKADLDGDGRNENVVAAWNLQGNGLGVSIWTVRVFSADWKLLDERNEVADWGPTSLVKAPAGRAGCDVAITSFVDDLRSARPGTAFEARFLRLQGGKLVEAADHPPVRARLLNSFMRERRDWFEAQEGRQDGGLYDGDIVKLLN